MENTQTLSITDADVLIASILISPDVQIGQVIGHVTRGTSVWIPLIVSRLMRSCDICSQLGCITLIGMVKAMPTCGG